MISVFVVSCPCALGVAIPLADDLAAAAMERLGVFTRTASLWPRLMRVRQVIFDKTGTLTLERPVLENPGAVNRLDHDAALALAQMTQGSLHPIARSLLEALGSRGQKLLAVGAPLTPREWPGLGVSIKTSDGGWSLGKAGWSGEGPSSGAATTAGSELRKNGGLVAAFSFNESLRPGALAMVQRLERRGLSLHLLSGDHPQKVVKMAEELGLPPGCAQGGLSPEEKASAVRDIDRQNTLYLGDGANDSLAFDASFVTGTPVVDRTLLESKADFYTLGSGLGFLPRLLDTAAARENAVRAAFAFAILYNLTTIAFSIAGKMSPLIAAIIMPLSSILSILIVATLSRSPTRNKD
jgi:Cu2+-exporting ATPase